MKHAFTKALQDKGHTLQSFADLLGEPKRNIDRMAANPKKVHWLAIGSGLPDKTKE